MAKVAWTLHDPADGSHYVFETNPAKGEAAAEISYKHSVGDSSLTDLGPVSYQPQDPVRTGQWSGRILTKDQYYNLWTWYGKAHVLDLTDDLGRVQHVYLTGFNPQRKANSSNPWFHSYTMDYTVVGIEEEVA